MSIKANLVVLSKSFFNVLIGLILLLALVVGIVSFVLWTIPTIPTLATIYFSARVLLAISTLLTIIYAFSNDYKQSVYEYLSR